MIYSQEHVSMNSTLYMVVLLALFKYFIVFTQIIQFLLFITKKEQIKDVKYFPDTTKIGFIWYYYELKHLISFFFIHNKLISLKRLPT